MLDDAMSAVAILTCLFQDPEIGELGKRILFAAMFHLEVSIGLRPAIGLPFRTVESWIASLPLDSHAGLADHQERQWLKSQACAVTIERKPLIDAQLTLKAGDRICIVVEPPTPVFFTPDRRPGDPGYVDYTSAARVADEVGESLAENLKEYERSREVLSAACRCVAVPRRASLFQGSFWRRLIQILRGMS